MSELSERLGYGPEDRLLIVNCDDLGLSYSANQGVYGSLRDGAGTSASLMVPCPWAREAASRYDGDDVGVHLTLNAEHELYRWGPLTNAPSLLDGDGGFPRTLPDLWEHADLDEVRRECLVQIERAQVWGFDVTHLDTHMGAMQLRPELFGIYLELAVEFQLPLRLTGPETQRLAGFPFRELADAEGVLSTDFFVYGFGVRSCDMIAEALPTLPAGVTEVYLHPSVESEELRVFAPDAQWRIDDYEYLAAGGELLRQAETLGIKLIGWREVRDLMRAG